MAEDKKNPQEASNIFHSIMKASVTPPKAACLECGSMATFVPPTKQEGKMVIVNYKCTKGHQFSKEFPAK
jgi:hypothetical protein